MKHIPCAQADPCQSHRRGIAEERKDGILSIMITYMMEQACCTTVSFGDQHLLKAKAKGVETSIIINSD